MCVYMGTRIVHGLYANSERLGNDAHIHRIIPL